MNSIVRENKYTNEEHQIYIENPSKRREKQQKSSLLHFVFILSYGTIHVYSTIHIYDTIHVYNYYSSDVNKCYKRVVLE